jgi:hypothetical protein
LPQSTLLVAETGNLMWYNRPAAQVFEGVVYMGWMTSEREVVIGKLNANTGKVIDSYTIHKWRYLDDHGAPILHVFKDGPRRGRVLVIYNLHNSEIYSSLSKAPDSISSWEPQKLVSMCECTYPTLIERKGVLYLFYRRVVDAKHNTKSYFMKTSADYGATWEDENEVVRASPATWIYATVDVDSHGAFHIVWGVHDENTLLLQNIYYSKSSDGGESWSRSDEDQKYELLESKKLFQVYRTPGSLSTRIWDIGFSTTGETAILSVDYTDNSAIAFWQEKTKKGEWVTVNLGANAQFYYPCGLVFSGRNTREIFIAKPDEISESSSIHRVEISYRDRSWSTSEVIQSNSSQKLCRPLSIGGESNLDVVFTAVNSYTDFMRFDTSLMGRVSSATN